jgi:hypothetical protein
MTFFNTDELISNVLHAVLALAFAIPAFGMAIHVAKHLV